MLVKANILRVKMNINTIGRFADQPILLNKLQKKMPYILITTGTAYGIWDTYKSSKGKDIDYKKQKAIRNTIIITSTAAASLIGANGLNIKGKKILPALISQESLANILKKQNEAADIFLSSKKKLSQNVKDAISAARKKQLSLKQTETLLKDIPEGTEKKQLLSILLPEPENLNSKGIFSEIGRLSLLGAIPVIGGVLGGIAADRITKTSDKNSTANKIKEGFYQYFANIFLCNVGACAALFIAEGFQKAGKIKPLSPLKKMAVILTGITATGIVGGSWIANKLSQNFIDPLFDKGKKRKHKSVYDERKPELADIALHVDDIATAGVLSGFKWIEPALPLMYFVSGYRAGIGYRNNKSL